MCPLHAFGRGRLLDEKWSLSNISVFLLVNHPIDNAILHLSWKSSRNWNKNSVFIDKLSTTSGISNYLRLADHQQLIGEKRVFR